MKYAFVIFCLTLSTSLFSQDANQAWKGNKAYRDRDYTTAQDAYMKSLQLAPSSDAEYNLANSLYKQQKYEDAAKLYNSIASRADDKQQKAQAYHNLGNSYLKSKQIDQGIEAYKQALRNNPGDEDTRYNLSYAMKLKKQQEEQQKQDQQNKDQQQDQQQDQKQDQQQKEEEQKQDEQKEQQQKEQEQKQQEQQQQQQQNQNELSKEDAARMLENMENEEEKTKEKVQLQKRKSSNVKIENDW